MNNEKDKIEALFDRLENDWDSQEPENGHEARFLEKLTFKRKKRFWVPMSVAASILILVGFFTFHNTNAEAKNLQFASKQTRETDSVFTSAINMELEKLKEKNTPENKKIIADALQQMQVMDADYEKIKQELIKNGENEQIIYAMISNLQIRMSFLQHVMAQIEQNNKLKYAKSDEKTI